MSRQLKVLVVEDDAIIRDNLVAYLEDEGMDVVAVATGEDAIEHVLGNRSLEICIMDMRLPGIDGNQAIRSIQEICPDMAFLIHTGSAGYTMPEDLRAAGLGEFHVIHKPVHDMALMVDLMRDLVTRRNDA